MSTDKETLDARIRADEMYDRDASQEEVRQVVGTQGAARSAFEERLALRGFLDADDDMPAAMYEPLAAGSLEALRAAYDKARPEAVAVRPITPQRWMELGARLGGDRPFIAKLARGAVTFPTRKALRDLADMLGAPLSQLRDHFAAGGLGLAGMEMKSATKPTQQASETFEGAVSTSNLPPALKARWLEG